ncbi:hypothetical protein [Cohnella zeiphila]|uniref:Uncharacterized protein n=1 Tax=Cohnella zeiphila TaxID=2761120 RepID=A0A7X0SNC6_9BACL|nr:hypothetical protein [Cohnella zeiphila]MBB6731895.1 hypothetical protein [Cohnella zeiphila]
MDGIAVEKKLVITYDVVSGVFTVENNDDMAYGEILAALEYTKFLTLKDWLKGEELL